MDCLRCQHRLAPEVAARRSWHIECQSACHDEWCSHPTHDGAAVTATSVKNPAIQKTPPEQETAKAQRARLSNGNLRPASRGELSSDGDK